MEEEGSPPMEKLELVTKPKSKSNLETKLKLNSKSKLEKKSKSPLSSSLSAWTEQLRKLVELVKQEVENKPGAYLWRDRRVEKAMNKVVTDNDLEYNIRRLHILQEHVKSRIRWLNMVQNDPLSRSFSTGEGWDLNRLWRLWHAIGRNRKGLKGLKGLEFEQEFISKGLIVSVSEYMKDNWPEEDKDVSLEEITHNFRALYQILENTMQKKKTPAASKSCLSSSKKSSLSLRIKLLKKKSPLPHPTNDNGDNVVAFKDVDDDDDPIDSLSGITVTASLKEKPSLTLEENASGSSDKSRGLVLLDQLGRMDELVEA